jgi:hypothetical protein
VLYKLCSINYDCSERTQKDNIVFWDLDTRYQKLDYDPWKRK